MSKNAQIGQSVLSSPRLVHFFGELAFRILGRRPSFDEDTPLRTKRMLVSRLDKLGDMVMTSGFLRELRHAFPEARITLLVNPDVFNLVEECPYIDDVLTFNWSSLPSRNSLKRHYRTFRYARRHLWKQQFDLAVVPRWDVDFYHENYLVYFSGSVRRVGYSEQTTPTKSTRNRGDDILFTHIIHESILAHEVEHNLGVIRVLGGKIRNQALELWSTEDDRRVIREFLHGHQVSFQDSLIAVGPGAGHPRRVWPLSRFIQVSRWLQEHQQGRLVILGGPDEAAMGEAFTTQVGHNVINAAGALTLRQSGALLQHCRFFLGNDSGLMHLAAAAGIPVAEISCHPRSGHPAHYNSPARFGPWGILSKIIQPATAAFPCSSGCEAETAHCILGISAEHVIRELKNWLPQLPLRDA